MLIPFKHFVMDVDGVLTDGGFLYNEDGKQYKKFGAHDSDGIKILRKLGLSIEAISADKRGFNITQARLNDMGVELTYVSEADRFTYVSTKYRLQDLIFIGDGLFDIKLLNMCGYGFAPANAPEYVRQYAAVPLSVNGGNGAIFEVALILLKRYKHFEILTEMGVF